MIYLDRLNSPDFDSRQQDRATWAQTSDVRESRLYRIGLAWDAGAGPDGGPNEDRQSGQNEYADGKF